MSAKKVVLTNTIHPEALNLLKESTEVEIMENPSAEVMFKAVADAHALIVRLPLPQNIFENCRSMQVVVRHGVGMDFIPVSEATKNGIIVANVPTANTQAVVEYTIGMFFLLARKFHELNARTHQGDWDFRLHVAGAELYNKTVGVVGLGKIGSRVAEICRNGLRMAVLGFDPYLEAPPAGVEMVSLERLFTESDFVTLHLPLTNETRGIAGEKLFTRMKPSAFLVNASRGAVLDENALYRLLADGKIGGAALDVFIEEPLGKEHPFLTLNNLILTPHAASFTQESIFRMGMESAEEVLRVFRGQKPRNFINPAVWKTRKQI
jgi:D-3-phosphoglycerate dehydrogenase